MEEGKENVHTFGSIQGLKMWKQTRPGSQIRPLDSWTPVPGASEAPCSNERLGENTRRTGIPMKGHFEF